MTIHGACNPVNTLQHFASSLDMAADLADWMPAVQRHMDASGVVPQLAIALGQLSTASSILASSCDYSFSQPGCCCGCRAAEQYNQESSRSSQPERCSGCRAPDCEQHGSSSSSFCCKKNPSDQVSAACLHMSWVLVPALAGVVACCHMALRLTWV